MHRTLHLFYDCAFASTPWNTTQEITMQILLPLLQPHMDPGPAVLQLGTTPSQTSSSRWNLGLFFFSQCGYHTGTIAAAVAAPLIILAMICGILFCKKRKKTRSDQHDDLHGHDNTAAFSNPVFIGKDGAGGASQATSVSNPVFTGEPPHASEDKAGGATHTAVHLHDQTQGTVCHRRLTFPIIYIYSLKTFPIIMRWFLIQIA